MSEVTIEQRFRGTVALVILHLRRVAHSNDIDAGFEAARELHMIGPEHETFIRKCLELDEDMRHGEGSDAGRDARIAPELVDELQACVLLLNSADPA